MEYSACNISSREHVKCLSSGQVSSHYSCSEEAEILEPAFLSTLAAVDHCFSLYVHSVGTREID